MNKIVSALAFAWLLAGCASDDDAATPQPQPSGGSYEQAGPSPVGHQVFALTDPARKRTLTVQVWYPAAAEARAAAEAGVDLSELVPEGPDRETFKGIKATAGCTTARTRSAAGAAPAAGTWPLVMFSHCHGCLRFSALSVAERLASRGVAVVAPDHTDDTVFDTVAKKLAPLNDDFLEVRAGDIRFVLDRMLDPADSAVPEALRGRFDAQRLGMMGHSYGAMTTGKVLQDDARLKAGFTMAAPPALLGGVQMSNITEPLFMLLAVEDNSIGQVGNSLIQSNYNDAAGRAWLANVSDAGHFSFSDLSGFYDFNQGCGAGVRQTDKSDFTYLDPGQGRALAASYAAAFFAWTLQDDKAAEAFLSEAHPADKVSVTAR